jgi:hypothetical protein
MFTTDRTFDVSEPLNKVGALPPKDSPPQLSAPLPNDPHGRRCKNAGQGRRNGAPSSSASSIPGGWQTIRHEVVLSGRAWIHWHNCLDVNANMDEAWAAEVLYQRADFFRALGVGVHIDGNPKLDREIRRRLDRHSAADKQKEAA